MRRGGAQDERRELLVGLGEREKGRGEEKERVKEREAGRDEMGRELR